MDIGIVGIYNRLGIDAAAAFLFWAVFSITLHELAHGWAAIWQGDQTPRAYGRMTANPLVHMGVASLVCLVLFGIAWGSMPTNPANYRWGRRGHIVVAGAGPALNLVLAMICWATVGILALNTQASMDGDAPVDRLLMFAQVGGSLNGMLALFNMLPVPPFDGAAVIAGFSRRFHDFVADPRVQNLSILVLVAVFVSGVGGLIARVAAGAGLWFAVFAGQLAKPLFASLGGI